MSDAGLPLNSQTRRLTDLLLYRRWIGLAALLISLTVLLALSLQTEAECQILERDYGIAITDARLLYATLTFASLLLFRYEPAIRAELSDGRATALIVAAAAGISFMAARLAVPDQAYRLFRYPPGLAWISTGLILLSVLAVLLVTLNPQAPPGRRLSRYATVTLSGGGAVLVVLHIAAVGHFMRLDLPDEPILGSIAVNYALTGDFSTAYDGSIYGSPDPSAARYYWGMGLWLRLLRRTDLVALRAFPLLVGGAALALVALALWHAPNLTRLGRLAGIVTFLSLTPVVRASHNLRADIGLAVYGALVLLSVVHHQRDALSRRWPLLAGLALLIGLESVPTYPLAFAAALALLLVAAASRSPGRRMAWRAALLYAAGCALACMGWAILHFLPDPAAQWQGLRAFAASYAAENTGRLAGNPLQTLLNYFFSFSLKLSPAEWLLVVPAIGLLFRRGTNGNRQVGAIIAAGLVTLVFPWSGTYGYLALLAPFFAYAVGHAIRTERAVMISVFVLLAAQVSAPLHDLSAERLARYNTLTLAEADLLTWQIPEGVTVLGEDKFWFTLHTGRRFLGWHGLYAAMRVYDLPAEEVLERLGVDVVICKEDDSRCPATGNPRFAPPTDFTITDGNYLVYRRRG